MSTNHPAAQRLKPFYERAHERDECDLVTAISHNALLRIGARVVNISPEGLCARTDHRFEKHDRLRVMLPIVGDYEAHVAWALQGVFGCAFTMPIDHERYCRMLAAIKNGRENWPRP